MGSVSLPCHGVHRIAWGTCTMDWSICNAVHARSGIQVGRFGHSYPYLCASMGQLQGRSECPFVSSLKSSFPCTICVVILRYFETQPQVCLSQKRGSKYGAAFRPKKVTTQSGYALCVPVLGRRFCGPENDPIFGVRCCPTNRISVLFFFASPFGFFSSCTGSYFKSWPVRYSNVEAHGVLHCLWEGSGTCNHAVCGQSVVLCVGNHCIL